MNLRTLVDKNIKLVVGVSGGADSMCLLHKLSTINKDNIVVVHINHNLRGEESRRDEEFVNSYCRKNKIEFISVNVDVERFVQDNKVSIEEGARILRFKAFREIKNKYDAKYIVLAHNSDDVCETFLLNLFRGTGIRGLKSISAINDDILRPLLDMSRKEIEEYNKINKIDYITDSSNLLNDYTRNKIRNELIPYIEDNINIQVKKHIINIVEFINKENEVLSNLVSSYLNRISFDKDKVDICTYGIKEEYIISELVRIAIDRLFGLKDIGRVHIEDILRLKSLNKPTKIDIPKGYKAKNIKNGIRIYKNDNVHIKLDKIEDIELKDLKILKDPNISKSSEKIRLSCGKIRGMYLRHREDGDYILRNKKIKLKDFFIKKNIDIFERDELYIIADKKRVYWIEGLYVDKYILSEGNEESIIIGD